MKEIGKYYVENEISVTVFENRIVFVRYLDRGTVKFTCDDSVDFILSIGEEMARILISIANKEPHEKVMMYDRHWWIEKFLKQANIDYHVSGYSERLGNFLSITGKPEEQIDLGKFKPHG